MRQIPRRAKVALRGALALSMVLAVALFLAREAGAQESAPLPFTFYLTHYELIGDMENPTGVRYHNNGAPFAQARDGSRMTFTGQGAWDPATERATGGGAYVIRNRAGELRRRGTWQATRFVSFRMLRGWWGIDNFTEEGWQGPPGSASFSGFLTLRVSISGRGTGVLRLWCLMPTVPKPRGHVSDGLSFVGSGLRYTDFRQQEQTLEGVMFYSR